MRRTNWQCDARQYVSRIGYRLPLALVVAMAFALSPALAQTEQRYEGLPNFHVVNEVLYRGGQPTRTGIERLAQLGVKTIINLRADDSRSRDEERLARNAGLRFFNVQISKLGKPQDKQVDRVLALMDSPENQPVFVHCKRGADRTGTIMAIYRIVHDGWTSEQAKREAKRFGMGWWQFGMKDYIRDFYKRFQRRLSERH